MDKIEHLYCAVSGGIKRHQAAMESAFTVKNGEMPHFINEVTYFDNEVVDKLRVAKNRGLASVVMVGNSGKRVLFTTEGDQTWQICLETGATKRYFAGDRCMFVKFRRKSFQLSQFSEKVKGDGHAIDPATREVIGTDVDAVQLSACGCVLLETTAAALAVRGQCPKCDCTYPEVHGAQPDGTLLVEHHRFTRCGGHPDQGTYALKFGFPAGVQSQGMQNVGERYPERALTAFVPSDKPDMVRLLVHAFERGVLFIVGHSLHHDKDNRITFGNIHMKTELNNWSGHGWDEMAKAYAMEIMRGEAANIGIKVEDCKPLTI